MQIVNYAIGLIKSKETKSALQQQQITKKTTRIPFE